jgi:acyl-CoA synthetase (AMP-forming)/AMP-acid ligase II
MISHRAVTSGGRNVMEGHRLTADDRALCVLPVYHINGAMVTVSAPLYSGGSVVMPRRFSAKEYWRLAAEHRCSWSSIVPTIIKYLLDRAEQEPYEFGNDERLAAMRFVRSASAPLAAVTLGEWEAVFKLPMIETLGLTETAGTVASNPLPPAPHKPGSVGLPYGNEIEIADEQGKLCAPGVVGELVIRGGNLLDHYYKNPEATEASMRDGWFLTGDLGKKDEDGYIFITGRSKELIIRGGENIAPREIDDVLYKHEAILEAAAVGVDDENYGQEVVACVVLRDGYSCSEDELKAFCENGVGKYKAPKIVYFFDDLPKGPSGKILRLQLPALIDKILSEKS